MKLGYYPGCALHGSSNDYEQSVRAALGALGVELNEIDEWICCGATAAHSLNHRLSIALPARNLALAGRQGCQEMFAPCPMCSGQLLRAQAAINSDTALRSEMATIVEAGLEATPQILNLIQVLQHVSIDALKAAVKKPLAGLKAACYYGCLLVRPPAVVEFDDAEQPESMETILAALGAKPVAWNFKTECCGAGMTMASPETVLELGGKILADAAAHGAECVVVACPMCHVNLDMKQRAIERHTQKSFNLPVYYLTDLVGLALGLDTAALGIDRHFVPAAAVKEA